jgi:hypothetical protein
VISVCERQRGISQKVKHFFPAIHPHLWPMRGMESIEKALSFTDAARHCIERGCDSLDGNIHVGHVIVVNRVVNAAISDISQSHASRKESVVFNAMLANVK